MDASVTSASRARRFLYRPFVWRIMAFGAVYLMAVVCLWAGVAVSERDLTDAGIVQKAYYALGLFVLGGLDLGTPTGGPPIARTLLWISYFAAPIITTFTIVEAMLRLIGPLALRIRPLRGHVVLGGGGRLTLLYVRKLRRQNRRRSVVVVERATEGPFLNELRDQHRAVIVQGDISSDSVLRELRLDHAHRVLLLTGDDFANLDAAAKILRLEPGLARRIVVHVSDLGFIRETAGSSVANGCDIFNGHEFAAKHLVHEHLVERFHHTPYRDPIILAGFGRFGRTVLDRLQHRAPGSFGPVVVVDHDATKNARTFEDEPGFSSDYERVVIDGDVLDPEVWTRVRQAVGHGSHDPVIIVGSGDDGTNLQAALAVRRQHPRAYVVVRSFRTSPFTEEIAREAGAHAVNLGSLIQDGMPGAWF